MIGIATSSELRVHVHRFKAGYHLDEARQHEQAAAFALQRKDEALMAHHVIMASDHARQAAYYASLVEQPQLH
jgi:hypothetical protein